MHLDDTRLKEEVVGTVKCCSFEFGKNIKTLRCFDYLSVSFLLRCIGTSSCLSQIIAVGFIFSTLGNFDTIAETLEQALWSCTY